MGENKTQPTGTPTNLFLEGILDKQKREDSHLLYDLFKKHTACDGIMWGSSIIGFGQYHYKYKSGREGDWFVAGFSPRKNAITLYLMCELSPLQVEIAQLGKVKTGKGCIYIRRLSDVSLQVLEQLIEKSVKITLEGNKLE